MTNRQTVLLSIIIPAYNVELYIKECLDSIFYSLTVESACLVEVIVINDGSQDRTTDILEQYDSRHCVFRVINQSNKGLSYARNIGINAARGKYLMFVDSDDYLVPDSLDKLITFLSVNENVDIVEYDFYEFVSADEMIKDKQEMPSISKGSGQEIYAAWVKQSYFRHLVWTKIVLRELVTTHRIFFYEGIVHEDDEWTPRIFAYARKVLYLPLHVYVYRIRPGSVMSTITWKNYFDKIKVFDSLVQFSLTKGFSKEYVNALKVSASSIYWWLFSGIKRNGKYDEELISKILEREYIIKYSRTFHRRFFYKLVVKLLGVKGFYFFKYAIKDLFRYN
ncbi:glycosyltransferase [Cloacibacillus sp.]|uniref:glycosyltransferase n=1 Tax=Cloacibacillus sp. TaxID=2049023 RepID=UPI0025B88122|nr:glycosyltransferase [Cloacibacillus sp.]MCC8057944.1 glycosyltransferase [Cloacibacillus sp.]